MENSSRHRRPWLVIILTLLTAAGLYTCSFSTTLVKLREAAEELLGLDSRPGYVFPTMTASQDFFGRAYIRTRTTAVGPITALTATKASALVGFSVAVPAIAGMGPVELFNTSQASAYDVHIDLDEARRILSASPSLAAELPADAQDFDVKVDIPHGVVLHQKQGDRWYTLIQNLPGRVQVDDSHDALYDTLQELGLRSLGLTPDQAHQVNQELGREIFYAIPPSTLLHAEAVAVNGSPALLFSQSSIDPELRHVIWKADGMLYGILGSLPPEELLQVAESLGDE